MFEEFSIAVNISIFAVLAIAVWLAGTRLSYYIDAVAEKTKLARAFLGLILLATATELPEMVTTLTASSSGNSNLALNNMYGGMLLQVAVLAIADFFVRNGTLTSKPVEPSSIIAGLFLIINLTILMVLNFVGDYEIFHLGLGSIITAFMYLLAMYTLKKVTSNKIWSAVDVPDETAKQERVNPYDELSIARLGIYALICAGVILASGMLVVNVAETLASQTGLGSSFIGVSLLAMTTSLPELSTSVAAVRVKAYSMAISNIFGSNLIMTFLIFPVDIFYEKGAVINEIDNSAFFALGAGILLTSIYSLGLLIRSKKQIFGIGIDSVIVMFCYIASLLFLYSLR